MNLLQNFNEEGNLFAAEIVEKVYKQSATISAGEGHYEEDWEYYAAEYRNELHFYSNFF